eukprot:3458000-Alexandrium_andersonii.AAC.1
MPAWPSCLRVGRNSIPAWKTAHPPCHGSMARGLSALARCGQHRWHRCTSEVPAGPGARGSALLPSPPSAAGPLGC